MSKIENNQQISCTRNNNIQNLKSTNLKDACVTVPVASQLTKWQNEWECMCLHWV